MYRLSINAFQHEVSGCSFSPYEAFRSKEVHFVKELESFDNLGRLVSSAKTILSGVRLVQASVVRPERFYDIRMIRADGCRISCDT